MCYNTSGTNKSHSGNAVPDADLTAFLVKGKKGKKKKKPLTSESGDTPLRKADVNGSLS